MDVADKHVHRDPAGKAWDGVLKIGAVNGYRNAQASVLAPTGCLTADTLVTTDRGLARLGEIGDVWGSRWQDLRLQVLTKELFSLEPTVAAEGHQDLLLTSVRVARWWQTAGFSKDRPGVDHTGQSWAPRIPSAILETNDVDVYAGFLRGLFEADGMVVEGVPSVTTASRPFAAELRTLLLALGVATTTREMVGGFGSELFQVRLRNVDHALRYDERIGFLGRRKNELVVELDSVHAGNRDRIALPRPVWDAVLAKAPEYRTKVLSSLRRHGGVPRQTAEQLFQISRDSRVAYALGSLFGRDSRNLDGG